MATAEEKSQRAAKGLFTAASAANAVPVFGQFASAGLAIAGLFVKMFGGKKQAKKAKKKAAQEGREADALAKQKMAPGGNPGAAQAQQPVGTTAPVAPPHQSSFTAWGGGSQPNVNQDPTQQALNNKMGV